MTQSATAWVFDGPKQAMRSESVPFPILQPGEVLAGIEACTLCGSDLHSWTGRRSTPTPTVLGHEILGRVEALPSAPVLDYTGKPLSCGDRITWAITVGCGNCFFCLHELPQKCEEVRKYGHEMVTPRHILSGGLSTHCHLLAGTAIFRVPDDLPWQVACPVSCATATVASLLRHAGELSGAHVLIQGAGMLGLTAAAMSHAQGATVTACDLSPDRLQMAQEMGASHIFSTRYLDTEQVHEILEITDGRGFDVILEVSGAVEMIEAGFNLIRTGGQILWAGAVFPTRECSILPELIVRRHLTICGVHNYHPKDLATALDFLENNHTNYPMAKLVERTVPLAEAEQALIDSERLRPVRAAIYSDNN